MRSRRNIRSLVVPNVFNLPAAQLIVMSRTIVLIAAQVLMTYRYDLRAYLVKRMVVGRGQRSQQAVARRAGGVA
ncbi:hypothetical protein EKO27_g5182 [Xylaria grammica]|uniref:Uncharacterized protein n=1 Tax=Xylaria grammica TaxID=363999 RepID=A0A439D6A6_9PEZI|nr:hypothetical protein EKO27_g5182 [Xylaria grammica]